VLQWPYLMLYVLVGAPLNEKRNSPWLVDTAWFVTNVPAPGGVPETPHSTAPLMTDTVVPSKLGWQLGARGMSGDAFAPETMERTETARVTSKEGIIV
jgi:hypothetical protein